MADQHQYSRSKVFVLGLDGGCFRVLEPLMAQGTMQNLSTVVQKGSRRVLRSTIPPVTGPAWTTFMTGVNPAKHGIYDFVQRVPRSVRRQVVHHNQIRANTLFQIAGQAALNVGAVNVPLTYPPPRLNGFAVSGMLTPGPDSPFTYPPELKEELNRVAKPYILDVWWKRYKEKQAVTFVEELTECLRHRTTAIRYLIENRQWDLFVAVLTEVDRIQHSLWRYLDVEENPLLLERLENRKIHDAAIAFFHTLDLMIGKILRLLPSEANLVIISDHGFGPMLRKFYVNSWLRNEGFLNFHEERLHSLQRRKKFRQTPPQGSGIAAAPGRSRKSEKTCRQTARESDDCL